MSKRKFLTIGSLAAVIVVAALIFYFSAQQGEDSARMSGGLTAWLISVLRPDFSRLSAARQRELRWIFELFVRKTAHFSEYTLLGFSLMGFARGAFRDRPKSALLAMAWLTGTIYAGTDELHQMFVEGRGPALTDVAIDSGGVLFGALLLNLLLYFWLRRRRRRAATAG